MGKGAYAQVFTGFCPITKQKVAIKVFNQAELKKTDRVVTIFREVLLMKKLHHPNVCRLLDTVIENEKIYLVLEHCGTVNLREVCDGFDLNLT